MRLLIASKLFAVPVVAALSLGLFSAVQPAPATAPGISTTAVPAAVAGKANLIGRLSSIADLKRIDPNHPGLVKRNSDLRNAPKWYQDSVFYRLWLDGLADSDGDGYGDLAGVLNHLDYLNDGKTDSKTSLGVNRQGVGSVESAPPIRGAQSSCRSRHRPETELPRSLIADLDPIPAQLV